MVAYFTGLGPGLERGSISALGGQGLLGAASMGASGDQVFVNATNGNLAISRRDEFLVGLGPDASASRTYNSNAAAGSDDNGDRWRQSTDRRVYGLSGTIGTAGSKVRRLSADGSVIIYTWEASRSAYLSYDGDGAYDTLTFAPDATTARTDDLEWTWHDGQTLYTEVYRVCTSDSDEWNIVRQIDADGNALAFTYDGTTGNVDRITTQNGEYIAYLWDPTKTRIASISIGGGTLSARSTYYGYDAQGRLSTVTVDLTPEDGTIQNGEVYRTTYEYDGTSTRITRVSQDDGSRLDIRYDSAFRVDRLTQWVSATTSRVTTISYALIGNDTVTTITDDAGQQVEITSTRGLLTKLKTPASETAAATEIRYGYEADSGKDNIEWIEDQLGNRTTFTYNSDGMVRNETDRMNNSIIRTYNTANQLLTETRTASTQGAANQSVTTRYVYADTKAHQLAYVITPRGAEATGAQTGPEDGEVRKYEYDAAGQLVRVTSYVGAADRFDLSGLANSQTPTRAAIETWIAQRPDKTQRSIEVLYRDSRGNLYASDTLSGAANGGDDTTSRSYIDWNYDQAGRLTGRTLFTRNAETTRYDGLGRIRVSMDANGGQTDFTYIGGGATTEVRFASGLLTTSTYDGTGALVAYAEAGATTTGGTTAYAYDAHGQLRRVTDPTGRKTYYIYDQYGRRTAEFVASADQAQMRMTEYRYDDTGRPIAIIRYDGDVQRRELLDSLTTDPLVSQLRPTAGAAQWDWRGYDKEGRLIRAIDGDGSTIAYTYDDSGQLIRTRRYFNRLSPDQIAQMKTDPTLALLPSANATRDAVSRIFYDKAGRVVGQLDAAGYLVRTVYDAGGRKTAQIAYAGQVDAATRLTATFNALVAAQPTTDNRTTRWVYDGRGNLRFEIDAAGGVTGYEYKTLIAIPNGDTPGDHGDVQRTVRYAARVSNPGTTVASVLAALGAAATSADNRLSLAMYDSAGRVAYTIAADGGVIGYTYDTSGRVVRRSAFEVPRGVEQAGIPAMDGWAASANVTNAQIRITRYWYTERGELRYVRDAEGFVTETQ